MANPLFFIHLSLLIIIHLVIQPFLLIVTPLKIDLALAIKFLILLLSFLHFIIPKPTLHISTPSLELRNPSTLIAR